MRIIFEIEWIRFGLALGIVPFWTRWYLPINVYLNRYFSSGELTLSILWIVHFSVRFPLPISKRVARFYLPRRGFVPKK